MSGSSDRRINYSLRPSKSIERKMILEVLKEICTPKRSAEFRYIGFGACFFSDFKLFHKGLNIEDMISIESKPSNLNRVKYNKPYACIKIEPDLSTIVLARIPWNKKSIVWLDYETELQPYMFNDIEIICRNAISESVMIITLRRDFEDNTGEGFKKKFGNNVLPTFKNEDLEPAKSSNTISDMFINKIKDTLIEKYSAYAQEDKLVFKQLFHITYSDDAKMYTFGGVFYLNKNIDKTENYNFNQLPFVGRKEKPYDISFPIITNKEFHRLTKLLPAEKEGFINNSEIEFIPKEHRENYYNTYKYYPAYIEIMDF